MSKGCKMVGYLRVSTAKQGASALGLEGQAAAIAQHVAAHGCRLLASYTEVETGKKDDLENRPMLRKALAHAKRSGAILVVAKLDRLSRSVAVTSALHMSGVEFICCDNPTATKMTIQILAAVAEQEARAISERTKDALAAAKARGFTRAGVPWKEAKAKSNLSDDARRRGAAATKARAATDYADVAPIIKAAREQGRSLHAIAKELNDADYVTPRGKAWTAMQVSRVLAYADEAATA